MRAMVFHEARKPLALEELSIPKPSPHQLLIKIKTCGVCRTDLHIVDGELTNPALPLILGHQIVGEIVELGSAVTGWSIGTRVGVPWLGQTCNHCYFCTHETENLCDTPLFTGYTTNGGYAEYTAADSRYCFALPPEYDDFHVAPLLCAGMIGFRSLRKVLSAETIGFYGFGAAAALLIQTALHLKKKIYAFTKEGDETGQKLALSLGATWAGSSQQSPPVRLDAAIVFAPVGPLVPLALKALRKGGTVVLGGIHMSPIPSFSYDLLWGERTLTSVANLTRQDGQDYLTLAREAAIKPLITIYPLEEANRALNDLRQGTVKGSIVLDCNK